MDNVYSNPGIPTFQLRERQEGTDGIHTNTERQGPRAKQSTAVGQCAAGVPGRYALALFSVLYLVLLCGLIALGVLYTQICYRSDSLEEENRKLSVSLSAMQHRLADMEVCYRLDSLKEENRNLSVSLFAMQQRLKDSRIENLFFQHYLSGMELRIKGVPKHNTVRFTIIVGHSKQMIALRFDVNFESRVIILNSFKNDSWEKPLWEKYFPFEAAREFELIIDLKDKYFYITLPNQKKITFQNRLGDKQYDFLSMEGDVAIHSITMNEESGVPF